MNNAQIKKEISNKFSINEGSLVEISSVEFLDDVCCEWAKNFCKEGLCFSNALNMTLIDKCEMIVGFAYVKEHNLIIQHAWNRDIHGDFDLTAQLFWPELNAIYFEIHVIKYEQSHIYHNNFEKLKNLYLRDIQ